MTSPKKETTMNKLQFRQLIREEIQKILNESGARGQRGNVRPDYEDRPKKSSKLSKIKKHFINSLSSNGSNLDIYSISGARSKTGSTMVSVTDLPISVSVDKDVTQVVKMLKDAGWISSGTPRKEGDTAYYKMTPKAHKLLKRDRVTKKRLEDIEDEIRGILGVRGGLPS